MAYVYLLVAIGSEVLGTSLMKSTSGFTRLWPTLSCLGCYAVSILLLSRAINAGMQVGIGYALWSALGTASIVIISAVFLGEPVTVLKSVGVFLVIAGVVLLNLKGAAH